MSEPSQGQQEDPVAEWLYLSDRAQQIYGGLVGLSDFGHWDTYFARTFDIYTRTNEVLLYLDNSYGAFNSNIGSKLKLHHRNAPSPTFVLHLLPFKLLHYSNLTLLKPIASVHRVLLESKDSYGLQRWEIGEIATRIAQLYYHYYLRTSDVSYLKEAYLFYDAVRSRHYYKPTADRSKRYEKDELKSTLFDISSVVTLYVKQLRFYARFIITCLLLDRRGMVNTLVEELSNLINEYSTAVRGAGETQEWHLVLQEITLFLQADVVVSFKGSVPADFKVPPRRSVFPPPRTLRSPLFSATLPPLNLKLQSCILVGCHQHQVKFSELTLDMYRMMYCLEREPSSVPTKNDTVVPTITTTNNTTTTITTTTAAAAAADVPTQPTSNSTNTTITNATSVPSHTAAADTTNTATATTATGAAANASNTSVGSSLGTTPRGKTRHPSLANPKKYLLYRPTVSQLLLYLASAQRELNENGTLLIYISADGEDAKLESISTPSLTPQLSVPPASPASLSTTSSSIPPSPLHQHTIMRTLSIGSSSSSVPAYSASTNPPIDPYAIPGVRLRAEQQSPSSSNASPTPPNIGPNVSSFGFFPADLTPFTRRPTFVIVDSENSHAFLNINSSFGTPLLVLVSPEIIQADILESSQAGSLFTYFLHDPLSAFLFTSNKTISHPTIYDQATTKVAEIMRTLDDIFATNTDLRTYLPDQQTVAILCLFYFSPHML